MSHRRTCCWAALLAAAVVTWGTGAEAAGSARALLRKGNKLFSAGDYAGALEAFRKGNQLNPSPFFLRSIGYSYLKMYQHDKAREALEAYVKKYPKQPDLKKVQDLVSGLEVVVQTKVAVTTTPPGADLYFDTEAAGRVASTPFSGTIEPGQHTLILRLGDYHTTVRPFSIAPRQTLRLEIPLEATLQVESNPPGASVHFDGEAAPSQGVTPLTTGIGPGKHKVILKLAGYRTQTEAVEVRPPTPVRLRSELGLTLRVASVPTGAKVELDGRTLSGVTPLEAGVRPGLHKIAVALTGYKPFAAEREVRPGQDNQVLATLAGGLLTMRTDAPGATVSVDGRQVGSTPSTEQVTVPLGRHQIAVSHPGRRGWARAVDFEEGTLVDARLKMARPSWPIWVAGAVALVGTVLGVSGYLAARSEIASADEDLRTATGNGAAKACADWNVSRNPQLIPDSRCAPGTAHLATTGVILAGTSAATGLIYWLVWGRSSAEVRKLPATAESQPPTPKSASLQ